MDDFEILKNLKISYETIREVIYNNDTYIHAKDIQILAESVASLGNVYEKYYKKIDSNLLKTDLNCPHCSNNVNISDLIDYAYVCENCDENFFLNEVENSSIWYLENKNGKIKYSIQIWETEDDRDRGESFEYLEIYDNDLQAIQSARKIFDKNNYACVEVIKESTNEVLFLKDSEEEQFYYNGNTISYVSNYILTKYIENWSNKKELPIDNNLLYCENSDKYIAVDNTTGDCWTEEFDNKEETINWLLGKNNNKELEENLNGI